MKAFIITSSIEQERRANVERLLAQLPDACIVEAVYPSRVHVPFLEPLMQLSEQRTGKRLVPGEIGCLLSHRKVWRSILAADADESAHFLVLESDSVINENDLLLNHRPDADLFFWGAWLGHMRLHRSSRKPLNNRFSIGVPFIKTVYCTYGYSLNQKAAAHLLKQTACIAYPVDQFKYIVDTHALRIGGIVPEVISGGKMGSYINQPGFHHWQQQVFLKLLDLKNNLICFFK
ncbi:MAG: glycosyltransferase family 25 protein [Sphingobacteriia bacterium]|nr:glycosyltransferase family 25 protein [Sphingobacteriia bacterium]